MDCTSDIRHLFFKIVICLYFVLESHKQNEMYIFHVLKSFIGFFLNALSIVQDKNEWLQQSATSGQAGKDHYLRLRLEPVLSISVASFRNN